MPLTEADLFDELPQPAPASPFGPPVLGATQPAAYAAAAGLPPNRYKPPLPKGRKKPKKEANRETAALIGRWAAGFVMIALLPVAGIFAVMAMYSYSHHGWGGQAVAAQPSAPAPRTVPRPSGFPPKLPAAPPATSRPDAEPAPAGQLVTIWDGKQSASGGRVEFSLEYRLDGLNVSPNARYFWIILDRTGAKVEFPIPAELLKSRDRLSGQPQGATNAQFQQPFRSFLERQSPGVNQRDTISNVIVFPAN